MHIALKQSGRSLTETAVRKFERRIGRLIPESYRLFLLDCNGGIPEKTYFEYGDDREPGDVRAFLGIGMPEETYDIDYVLNTFAEELPIDLFPVARDPGGNLIGIRDSGTEKGVVILWDHEEMEQSSEKVVAPDFESLLKLLI